MKKIGINGFGRIGRALARILLQRNNVEIVAINTRKTEAKMIAYLLKYDSVYRTFAHDVDFDDNNLYVNGKKIALTHGDDPSKLDWSKYGVDLVVDATGKFCKTDQLSCHIQGSVTQALLTAPAKDDKTPQIVLGVNDETFDFKSTKTISNASCTTNCATPLLKILDDNFKIKSGMLTTAHAYTASQSLLDEANKDETRSRAAALSLIPTTTGAADAVAQVLPNLAGKIDGMAVRVPVPTVSFVDLTVNVEKSTTIDEINNVFKQQASLAKWQNILAYEETALVSSDYVGSVYSAIFDANYTKVLDGNLVKVCAWYDNEWGYSNRLADMIERM